MTDDPLGGLLQIDEGMADQPIGTRLPGKAAGQNPHVEPGKLQHRQGTGATVPAVQAAAGQHPH